MKRLGQTRWRWWWRTLGLALAYWLTAALVYRFADPASYAASVFPSAGIALAAMLAWGWRSSAGIFLGSVLLNLTLTLGQSHLPLALAIPATAVLQALFGAGLCWRYARQQGAEGPEWNEFRLILLGGPLACVVAPLLANALIYFFEPQPAAVLLFNIWSWWVGDTLGVVVFTPLCLLVLQKHYRRQQRLLPAIALPFLVLSVVLVLYTHVNRQEQQRLEANFRDQARELGERLNLRLQTHADMMRALRRFWMSSQTVDAQEFSTFVAESLQQRPDLRFLGWAARRKNGAVELAFVEPGMQRMLLGLDFMKDERTRAAVLRARDSGQLSTLSGLQGYALPGLHDSVVLFMPIYTHGRQEPRSVQERRQRFQGVTLAVFDLEGLLASLSSRGGHGLLLHIDDGKASPTLIYHSEGQADAQALRWHNILDVGNQRWHVMLTSPAGYRQANRSYEPSLVMMGALFSVALLQVLLLTLQRGQALRLQTLEAEKARISAEQATEVKSRFLATMSHEIRTPMNGIIGMTQLLADTRLGKQQQHFVSTIRQSCEALLHILNDILDYSKIEAGRLEIEKLPVDLPRLLQECVSLFQQQAESSHIPLQLELDAAVPRMLEGDPVRIRQVLINLLGNAYKFTRSGRIDLRVRMERTESASPWLRFEVQDTGIGINAAQQAQLFRAFSQGDSSITRQYGGTGLGLSICRLLVELMQGEMGVDSAPGQGSLFWFRLPLVQPLTPSTEPERAVSACDFSRLRVLVVEDNAVNQMVMAGMLKKWGIHFHVVTDGVEAVQALVSERQAFDVVLMDCEMPNMDGYTATERLRQWQQSEEIGPLYICGVSAHVLPEYRERALAAGMDDFIAKPLRRAELQRVLEAALQQTVILPA